MVISFFMFILFSQWTTTQTTELRAFNCLKRKMRRYNEMIGSSRYSSRCFRKGRFWDSVGSVMLCQIYLVEKRDRFGVRLIHVLISSLVMLLYCTVRVICPSRETFILCTQKRQEQAKMAAELETMKETLRKSEQGTAHLLY